MYFNKIDKPYAQADLSFCWKSHVTAHMLVFVLALESMI